MNSKERILATVRHQPPDRVPTIYDDFRWVGLKNRPQPGDDEHPADQWGVVSIPRDGMVHGEIRHPVSRIEELRTFPFPDPLLDERWAGVAESVADITEHWSLTCLGPTLWERMHFICGMENAMCPRSRYTQPLSRTTTWGFGTLCWGSSSWKAPRAELG